MAFPNWGGNTRFIGPTGPSGPAGNNGVSGGQVLYMDSATSTTVPTLGSLLSSPVLTAQTTISHSANSTTVLIATFPSPVGGIPAQFIPPGLWDMNVYASASSLTNSPYFYWSLYQVDSDGVSNPVLIADGSGGTIQIANLPSSQILYDSPLFIPSTTLPAGKRVSAFLYVIFQTGSRTATFEFRAGAISHIHTTIGETAYNWSTFPAISDVNVNGYNLSNVGTIRSTTISNSGVINSAFINNSANVNTGALVTTSIVNSTNTTALTIQSPDNDTVVSGNRVFVNATQGSNIGATSDIGITASNGYKGRINLLAQPGYENGVYGEINLTAEGGTVGVYPLDYATGGLITLNATTPLSSLYTTTSAIKLTAASILSYAGAVTPIGSLTGFNYIQGTLGVNICAGLGGSANAPGTVYLYGLAGTTIQNGLYTDTIYNRSGVDLNWNSSRGTSFVVNSNLAINAGSIGVTTSTLTMSNGNIDMNGFDISNIKQATFKTTGNLNSFNSGGRNYLDINAPAATSVPGMLRIQGNTGSISFAENLDMNMPYSNYITISQTGGAIANSYLQFEPNRNITLNAGSDTTITSRNDTFLRAANNIGIQNLQNHYITINQYSGTGANSYIQFEPGRNLLMKAGKDMYFGSTENTYIRSDCNVNVSCQQSNYLTIEQYGGTGPNSYIQFDPSKNIDAVSYNYFTLHQRDPTTSAESYIQLANNGDIVATSRRNVGVSSTAGSLFFGTTAVGTTIDLTSPNVNIVGSSNSITMAPTYFDINSVSRPITIGGYSVTLSNQSNTNTISLAGTPTGRLAISSSNDIRISNVSNYMYMSSNGLWNTNGGSLLLTNSNKITLSNTRNQVVLPLSGIVASGGTVTTIGNRKFHTFTSNGDFVLTSVDGTAIRVMGVGGGGGGGGWAGGGGGAGNLITADFDTLTPQTIAIRIGAGGAGGTGTTNAGNGQNSTFGTTLLIANGGGGGGGYSNSAGLNGGCGGGGSELAYYTGGAVGLGSTTGTLVNNLACGGGTGDSVNGSAGGAGGGGVGSIGSNISSPYPTIGGDGGYGASYYGQEYGGGGGGCEGSSYWPGTLAPGAGGAGGGGRGGTYGTVQAVDGTANTGGGGGGGTYGTYGSGGGANGGSGIVIVSYIYIPSLEVKSADSVLITAPTTTIDGDLVVTGGVNLAAASANFDMGGFSITNISNVETTKFNGAIATPITNPGNLLFKTGSVYTLNGSLTFQVWGPTWDGSSEKVGNLPYGVYSFIAQCTNNSRRSISCIFFVFATGVFGHQANVLDSTDCVQVFSQTVTSPDYGYLSLNNTTVGAGDDFQYNILMVSSVWDGSASWNVY